MVVKTSPQNSYEQSWFLALQKLQSFFRNPFKEYFSIKKRLQKHQFGHRYEGNLGFKFSSNKHIKYQDSQRANFNH